LKKIRCEGLWALIAAIGLIAIVLGGLVYASHPNKREIAKTKSELTA
jgi:hypothetical protein